MADRFAELSVPGPTLETSPLMLQDILMTSCDLERKASLARHSRYSYCFHLMKPRLFSLYHGVVWKCLPKQFSKQIIILGLVVKPIVISINCNKHWLNAFYVVALLNIIHWILFEQCKAGLFTIVVTFGLKYALHLYQDRKMTYV